MRHALFFLLIVVAPVLAVGPSPLTPSCRIGHLVLGDPLRLEDSLVEEHHLGVDRLVEGQLLAEEVLDTLVQLHVVLRDDRHGLAVAASAGGSPDAVNVGLGVRRNVVVDDHVHVRDVQTAGGHVSGQQYRASLRFKLVQ